MQALRIVLLFALLFVLASSVHLGAVTGDSMEPTIYDGDFLVVQEKPLHAVSEGDVVAFECHGNSVVHRVEERESNGDLVTKGDAANDVDECSVGKENLIGRVAFSL